MPATQKPNKIRCDACPVMCYIADGRAGACDRYANEAGQLVRLGSLTILEHQSPAGEAPAKSGNKFVTAVGAGTTYPDYKPAPFIVSTEIDGIDMITVVTEGIFSYCGAKVKIDTDRHVGPERSLVRAQGEPVGHVTTGEYGSQMLSLGGVHHLTGGGKKEGRVTCATLMDLCNAKEVNLTIDDGAELTLRAGAPPIINGKTEERMRVGCGSATIGMFATQWQGKVDEVVIIDDHITGVVSEHQAGKVIGWQPTGIKVKGRKSTPGRYFQVAEPGSGWGGTTIENPLDILGPFNPKFARPGMTILMISTTGDQFGYYVLDNNLEPQAQAIPKHLQPTIERIEENCEPALTSVLFMGGAGGSLRAGVTENPVKLTRSVQAAITTVTCAGAPTYRWPGGGITIMVDVTKLPANSFGYVPTPALVAPIEFTMTKANFEALGGHLGHVLSLESILDGKSGPQNDHIIKERRAIAARTDTPWPMDTAS